MEKETTTTAIEKLNPQDFGLEESNVATIEQAFMPKIIERNALAAQYEELTGKEITPELCHDFKELRLKLVKVRTGIAEIHKTQKAYFLAAGRFVDAWKNKETAPIEQMEEKLKEGEEYYARLEAKRISGLSEARRSELSEFTDVFPENLGLLSDEAYATYRLGAKAARDAKLEEERLEKEAEEKRLEQERELQRIKERNEARFKLFAGTGYVFNGMDFTFRDESVSYEAICSAEDADFEVLIASAKDRKAEVEVAEAMEAKRIAEEKAKAEAELEKQRKKAAEEKAKADAALKAQQEAAAEEKRKQDELIRKQQEEIEAAKKKKAEEDRIAAEKAETDRIAKEAALKAPKKKRLNDWIDSISIIAPEGMEEDAIVATILEKAGGFKSWAKKVVDSL